MNYATVTIPPMIAFNGATLLVLLGLLTMAAYTCHLCTPVRRVAGTAEQVDTDWHQHYAAAHAVTRTACRRCTTHHHTHEPHPSESGAPCECSCAA